LFLPTSTPTIVQHRLKETYPNDKNLLEIISYGSVWDEANELALKISKERNSGYVHPFDEPEIWKGHSTLIQELKQQMGSKKPDVLVLVVGGGGLLCGICLGLEEVGWKDVHVLACETLGADSFSEAVKAGKLVTLPSITSIAKTLGAKTVCAKALECTKTNKVKSIVLSDKQAIDSCLKFADDHRFLVEPSCGVGLATIYESDEVKKHLQQNNIVGNEKNIVIIVCGGSGVSISLLEQWKNQLKT